MVSPYAELTVYHPRPGLRTAAEIKRQKTRRQEGDPLDAIFLLLEGHRQSPRRRRGRRPRARGARSLVGLALGGQRLFFSKTHDPPGAVALRRRVCATRNFPPRGTRNSSLPPPHPPSASLAATPKAGDPLVPGDASVVCQGRRGFFLAAVSEEFLFLQRRG